jgi:hypothetical protein
VIALVSDPREYHGLGSERHTVDELMQMTEYSEASSLE